MKMHAHRVTPVQQAHPRARDAITAKEARETQRQRHASYGALSERTIVSMIRAQRREAIRAGGTTQ